jgi:hypothetical protein
MIFFSLYLQSTVFTHDSTDNQSLYTSTWNYTEGNVLSTATKPVKKLICFNVRQAINMNYIQRSSKTRSFVTLHTSLSFWIVVFWVFRVEDGGSKCIRNTGIQTKDNME